MAAGPENRLRGAVHGKLNPKLYHMKNNNMYVAGVPDDWYCGDRSDLWVEWKFLAHRDIKKRGPTSLTAGATPIISPLQQDWLLSRHKQRRNVAVIVGIGTGCIILPGRAWQKPLAGVYELAIPRNDAARWIEQQTMRPAKCA